MNLRGWGELRLGRHGQQNFVCLDRFARLQKQTQYIIYPVKPFVLGGVQQLEILLDRRSFRRGLEQLIIN